MELELGLYQDRVDARLERWDGTDLLTRLKQKDLSLWHTRREKVTDMLGWLTLGRSMRSQMDDVLDFAQQICSYGITEVVLLGMGGSSMAPCVFRRTFGVADGHPNLTVLDSTHPDAVRSVIERIEPSTTQFIVSSKSGGTIETLSMYRYFWEEMRSSVTDIGKHFAAISDPGTPLAQLAAKRGFRRTFEADPDVGGRYSALSAFGLVPAALLGVDVRSLLENAFDAWENDDVGSVRGHEGLVMGAALGELTSAGKDKATILTSASLRSFPAWAEQLLAESTGKDGKGIVPIAGEPWLEPDAYAPDRMFIGVTLDGEESSISERLRELAEMGHPAMHMVLESKIELGRAMFEWELATATAAIVMGIDPFDQPDVQATKELAWDFVSARRSQRGRDQGMTFYLDEPDELRAAAEEWLALARPGDYISIQAYLGYGPEVHDGLRRLQADLLTSTGLATTMGYGPRFLHSTGQLHKGGPNTGLFLQLVDSNGYDMPVPGTEYSFGELTRAEAMGDAIVLRDRGRRVLRIDLGDEGAEGVARLRDMFTVMSQARTSKIMV